MAEVVKNAVQFPDEEDLEDCPVPASESIPESVGEESTRNPAALVNGICNGEQARHSRPVVICSSDENGESSSDEDDEDDENDDDAAANNNRVGTERQVSDRWKIEDGENINCECFICNHKTKGYDAADVMKIHIESAHNLPFEKLKATFKLDYPGFVQFVRWAREMKEYGKINEILPNLLTLAPSTETNSLPWSCDKYLLPPSTEQRESQEDYFLTLDFFALDDKNVETESSKFTYENLVSEIQRLQLDKDRMAEVFQRILSEKSEFDPRTLPEVPKNVCPSLASGASPLKERRFSKKSSLTTPASQKHIYSGDSINHNNLYFDSYDEVGIHHEMIFDKSRTDCYRSAIVDRSDSIKGNVVMDLGCGSGILSMFCAQEGARVVHAVDKSNIIFDAMSNSFENNFDKTIKFHHKDLDNDDTSDLEKEGKVDVLVSEFMGYFLFFEGMTESFIRARNNYLKPGGVLMPDRCVVELAPLGPTGLYNKKVACWDSVYGFKMPALKDRCIKEPLIELVNPKDIIGKRVTVKDLDLVTCDVTDVYISEDFVFEFDEDTEFCAIAGFFSVEFNGPSQRIILPTSPWDTPTHWKQTVFFLPKPFKVTKGEKLKARIKSCPRTGHPRWLMVLFEFEDIKFMYEIK